MMGPLRFHLASATSCSLDLQLPLDAVAYDFGAGDGNRTRDSCMASKDVTSSTTPAILVDRWGFEPFLIDRRLPQEPSM